jgi:hypothetical protein
LLESELPEDESDASAAAADFNSQQHFIEFLNELVRAKYKELFNSLKVKNEPSTVIADLNLSEKEFDSNNYNKNRNVYAAIIQSIGRDTSSAKIVCFATGTKCINGKYKNIHIKSNFKLIYLFYTTR